MPTVNATAKTPRRQTEEWKDVVGYEGYYMVSNLGRIKSIARVVPMCDGRKYRVGEKILKPAWNGHYHHVVLSKDGRECTLLLHRLVLEAFAGSCPEGMECRHLNGDAHDNRLKNLRWGTKDEQVCDKESHGTTVRGWVGNSYKIRDKHPEVFARWKAGESMPSLAVDYGVRIQSISYIIHKFKQKG